MKLFRVEMTRISYVLAEDEIAAEDHVKWEENVDECKFDVSMVKKDEKPDGGWKPEDLVYGDHREDISLSQALEEYGA